MELRPDALTYSRCQHRPAVDSCRWHFVAPLLLSVSTLGGEGWIHAKADSHLQLIAPKHRLLEQRRGWCWAKKHFLKTFISVRLWTLGRRVERELCSDVPHADTARNRDREVTETAFQYYYFKFRYDRRRRKRWAGEDGAVFCTLAFVNGTCGQESAEESTAARPHVWADVRNDKWLKPAEILTVIVAGLFRIKTITSR